MEIKYINRQRSDFNDPYTPCWQLVNIPLLQGTQRCEFCRYRESYRTLIQYLECSQKNKCGEESLLWPWLASAKGRILSPNDAHFSPTPVIKSLKIDNMTRYIQLWSCDLEGYQCCRLCQFYPSRIESDQSIADCSNSHACGRNGSWWDLLTIAHEHIQQIPSFLNTQLPDNQFYTMDSVLHTATINRLVIPAGGYVQVEMSDGNTYYLLNVLPDSSAAWYLCVIDYNDVATINFGSPYDFEWPAGAQLMVLNRSNHPVMQALVTLGMPTFNIYNAIDTQYKVDAEDSASWYFTASNFRRTFSVQGNKRLVRLRPVSGTKSFYIRFRSTNYYLGCYEATDDPSKWSRLEFSGYDSPQLQTIVLHTRSDNMVQFLLELGCRETLFHTLPIS